MIDGVTRLKKIHASCYCCCLTCHDDFSLHSPFESAVVLAALKAIFMVAVMSEGYNRIMPLKPLM